MFTFQGTVVGPEVCDALKLDLGGKVGCQGIGGAYTAGLAENFLPKNTAPQDIQAAVDVFNKCNTKCPNAKIVAGGYRYVTSKSKSHSSVYPYVYYVYNLWESMLTKCFRYIVREVPSSITRSRSWTPT